MGKFHDRTGQTVGRLRVIKRAPDFISRSGKHRTMWECRCECGNIVIVRSDCLNGNHTLSCGCYHSDVASEYMSNVARNISHGDSEERLYNIWYLMHYRCENPKFRKYDNYGGRGIEVCEEWANIEGYIKFKEWALNNGYTENLTIDRINVNGNYEPANCRWITKTEQAGNKRTNRLIEFNGHIETMAEWSRVTGVPYKTLHRRIQSGWSIKDALTKPIRAVHHIKRNDG